VSEPVDPRDGELEAFDRAKVGATGWPADVNAEYVYMLAHPDAAHWTPDLADDEDGAE
jgi:hypothetical protein